MASFPKAISLLESLTAELKALQKQYSNPKIEGFLKLMGDKSVTRSVASGASSGSKVVRYGSDEIKKVLDAVAGYVKSKTPTVDAFKRAANIPPNVAKALVAGEGFPGNPRNKTIKSVADWLEVKISLPAAADTKTDSPKMDAPKKGRKAKA